MCKSCVTYLLTYLSKIEDGNFRAAIRLICSDDTIAADSEEGPCLNSTRSIIHGLPRTDAPVSYNQSDLICRFLKGMLSKRSDHPRRVVQAGHGGLRPQHLRDLIGRKQTPTVFFASVTAFINVLRCQADSGGRG